MFLHLGHNTSVRAREVGAIYDYALFAPGGANAALLARAEAAGRIQDITSGKPPRALVITEQTIYLSAISHMTLLRRMRSSYRY